MNASIVGAREGVDNKLSGGGGEVEGMASGFFYFCKFVAGRY